MAEEETQGLLLGAWLQLLCFSTQQFPHTPPVTIRKINTVEEQYRNVIAKGPVWMEQYYKGKVLTHLWRPRLTGKTPQGTDLQPEILPQWQSALKWGLREVQTGCTPSSHTAELPSPVLPGLTRSFPRCSISCSCRDSTVPIHPPICWTFLLENK